MSLPARNYPLDRVRPVDNRPSNDYPHHCVREKKIIIRPDTWHVTLDTLHLTHVTWHVTWDVWYQKQCDFTAVSILFTSWTSILGFNPWGLRPLGSWPWDLPRHSIHHYTPLAFPNNVLLHCPGIEVCSGQPLDQKHFADDISNFLSAWVLLSLESDRSE